MDNQHTESSFEANKEYAENLSHELLSPLAVIRSKVELLLQSPNLRKEDMDNLDVILKTVQRMSKLNRALILLSKIDNHVFVDKAELDMNEIISDSLEKFEDQIRLKQLQIRFKKSDPFKITGNYNLLEVLITNLVKNAVFHNIEGGSILIKTDQNQLIIENTTDHASLSETDLYQRFVSSRNTDNSIGLGMAIIKRICDLFNYQISYESSKGIYRFTIQFDIR